MTYGKLQSLSNTVKLKKNCGSCCATLTSKLDSFNRILLLLVIPLSYILLKLTAQPHINHVDNKTSSNPFCVILQHITKKTPMKYTAIFHCCKIDNFQMKNCDVFLIFAQNIDCGYILEPPQ